MQREETKTEIVEEKEKERFPVHDDLFRVRMYTQPLRYVMSMIKKMLENARSRDERT